MISARERDIVLVKLSANETLNDLYNLAEAYEIKSAIIRGFGELKVIETEDKIIDAGEAIIEGIISDLEGRPRLELFCHTQNFTGKIKNFVANGLMLTIKRFFEIDLISRTDEKGRVQLTIANKGVKIPSSFDKPSTKEASKPISDLVKEGVKEVEKK